MSQGMTENAAPEVERDDPIADVKAAMAQLDDKSVKDGTDNPEAVLDEAIQAEKPEGRDKKGRFAPKARELATEEIQAATDSQEVKPDVGQTTIQPPTSWSPEAKAEWNRLSPALQQAVIKREQEVTQGFAQKSDELRNWKEIEGVIAPRRQYFQKFGFKTDVDAINHLLTFSDGMERDAAGTLNYLAKQFGLAGSQTDQRPNPPPPQMDIDKVVEDHLGLAFARREIEDFKTDTKAYPHFETLRPLMSHLLMSGQAKDLASAYESALYANPELRQAALAEREKKAASKVTNLQTERVNKAKQATRASLSGAPHGSPPRAASKPSNLNPHDDAIADVRAAMEQLG